MYIKKVKKTPIQARGGKPSIIKWDVPLKNNTYKNLPVVNWPIIFKDNFTATPIVLKDFYAPFKSLFGPFEILNPNIQNKYINTVEFINTQLSIN